MQSSYWICAHKVMEFFRPLFPQGVGLMELLLYGSALQVSARSSGQRQCIGVVELDGLVE